MSGTTSRRLDLATRWSPSPALSRALVTGGLGIGAALVLGRPVLVVLMSPLLLLAAIGLLHKPRTEPLVTIGLGHGQLHEGQGTRSRLEIARPDDVEVVSRVVARAPYVSLTPAAGAVGYLTATDRAVKLSPRRWGRRTLGDEKVALHSPWAGYRWGPVPLTGREMYVLPSRSPWRQVAEAPQPIGLVGSHRSRRDGNGSEFSSIREFHTGDRLRRINWRVSLRTGSLHVESTRAEEDTAVLLIVDALADYGASTGLGGTESSLDVTVRAAAALAEQYLHEGDRVSLRVISPAGESVGLGAGSVHLRRVLGRLARIRPGIPQDVDLDRISFRVTPGTLVIVLSPMLAGPLGNLTVRLVRRGLLVTVVDTLPPDVVPTSAEGRDPRLADLAWQLRLVERKDLLTQLAGVGCPVVPWAGPLTLVDVMRRLAVRTQLPRAGGS